MDSEATKSSTEWLKSSCAVVGAGFLSELCQRIELDVVNQNSDRIAILVQNFETEFNKVLKRLCEISCKRASDVGLLKESASTSKIEPSPTSAGILLVEDSLVNQEVATSLLSVAGHQITVASNGTEALEFLQKRSFDIILMDCQMPGLDGMETTKRIRKSEFRHGHARTPIVALTANALNGDRMQCINADMDDYLSKPYSPGELLSIVDRWVAPRDQVDLPTNCDAIYSKAG
jgi:CheY-like chemotaxis protein